MASARRGARVAWFAGARVGRQEQDPLLSGCLPIARGPGGQARSPSRARPRSAMSCLASTAGLPVSRLAENAEAVSIACRNRQALPRWSLRPGRNRPNWMGRVRRARLPGRKLVRLNSGAGESW